MRFSVLITAFAAFMLSGCATIFNGRYQKITIQTTPNEKVLIDGDEPKMKKGKYLVKRDFRAHEVKISSPGCKDEYHSLLQRKLSPLCLLSTIFITNDMMSSKAWNYRRKAIVPQRLALFNDKVKANKSLRVEDVQYKVAAKDFKNETYASYRKLEKNKKVKANRLFAMPQSSEGLKGRASKQRYALNKLLKEKGFIDTTNTLLKSSYLEDLSLKATITALTYKSIWGNMRRENMFVAKMDQLLETSVNVEWKICDYYGNEVLTEVFSVKSDHFTVGVKNSGSDKVHQNSIQDALVKSLIELFQKPEFIKILNDKSALETENEFASILLAQSEAYVNSLSEAVKSTVTVKSKNGFGSGFIIGREGYIVTNYHVVSDTSELQVIMNDNSVHKATLVRSSKTSDLALLKIEAKNLLPFNINNTSIPELAVEVYAVGTPSAEDLSQTISKGIVSGFRMKDKNKLIQTDASINGGNSGGPLVTKDGKVQAIVVSKIKGFGVEGIAFGIPVAEIIKRLKVTFEPVTK